MNVETLRLRITLFYLVYKTTTCLFNMTHDHYGRSTGKVHKINRTKFTYTRSSDGTPNPDGDLKNTVRNKLIHYRSVYGDRPDH